MKVIMYTGNNCGKCNGAKVNLGFLPPEAKDKLKLTEINVDKSEKDMEFLKSVIRSNSLPTFLLEDTHGSYHMEDGIRYEAYIGFENAFGGIQEGLGL